MSENECYDYWDGSECYEEPDEEENNYRKGVTLIISVKKGDKKMKKLIREFNRGTK